MKVVPQRAAEVRLIRLSRRKGTPGGNPGPKHERGQVILTRKLEVQLGGVGGDVLVGSRGFERDLLTLLRRDDGGERCGDFVGDVRTRPPLSLRCRCALSPPLQR